MPLTALAAAILLSTQPAGAPYTVLPPLTSTSDIKSPLPEPNTGTLVREGDTLIGIYRGDASNIYLQGGIQQPMKRIEGTDIWTIRLQSPHWDKAIVTYDFMPMPPTPGFKFNMRTYRGKSAPPAPREVTELKNKPLAYRIPAPELGGERGVTVYLPPVGNLADANIVVMADGQGAEGMARALEAAILDKRVAPTVILGIHNGGYEGTPGMEYDPSKDLRAREYLEEQDPDRFTKHLLWVIDGVLPWAREKYGLTHEYQKTAVFGFSNGGAFAYLAAIRRPEVFGVAIPLSLGYSPQSSPETYLKSHFYFASGAMEPGFNTQTKLAYWRARKIRVKATHTEYMAGHDENMWKVAFIDALEKAFPAR